MVVYDWAPVLCLCLQLHNFACHADNDSMATSNVTVPNHMLTSLQFFACHGILGMSYVMPTSSETNLRRLDGRSMKNKYTPKFKICLSGKPTFHPKNIDAVVCGNDASSSPRLAIFRRPQSPDEVVHMDVCNLDFMKNGPVERRINRILQERPLPELMAAALERFPICPYMSRGASIIVSLHKFIEVS